MKPPLPPNEIDRLLALRAFGILDTPPEPDFDELARLAASLCGTPIALIGLVDEHREWFKSKVGWTLDEIPRDQAFGAHALGSPGLLEVPDTASDPRFADTAWVKGKGGRRIRFYAGSPLSTPDGRVLGTLCVLDHEPRRLTEAQATALAALARQVMTHLQMRRFALEKDRAESALLGILEDQMQAERALRQSEREQRDLARSLEAERARLAEAQAVAKVGSRQTDPASGQVDCSEQTHRIFETDPAVLEPTHTFFLERVHPEDRTKVSDAFVRSLKQPGSHVIEHRLMLPDGRIKHVEERWRTCLSEEGVIQTAVGTCQDISERRTLEEQFLRAQRLESIGTLAGGIAHDLNNLLTPIIMGVDLLRQLGANDDGSVVMDTIESSARRGANLVRQVLSFARGVDGARVAVKVADVVREVEAIIANTFPKNLCFEANLPQDLWLISGDPTQINQVLLNLCVNARDAMPHGGRLAITARNALVDEQSIVVSRGVSVGSYVVVEVADTGVGMTGEVIARIFEPFFTTKELGSGTGLGLSTVLGIVRSHGGFVQVESQPGRGSLFQLHLPAHATAAAPVSPDALPADPPRGEGELILVVDDESLIRSVTQRTLEAFGYRVILAADGAQAISQFVLRRSDVALILTDMMMPVMDGSALMGAVHRLDPELPIIAFSGLESSGKVAEASSLGVTHFLPKPYSTVSLLSLIKRVLRESPRRVRPDSDLA